MLIFGVLFSGGRVVVDRRIVLITNFGGFIMGGVDVFGSLFVALFAYFSLKLISSADNKAEIPF